MYRKGINHPNYKHGRSSKINYCECNKKISWRAKRCKSCANKISTKKYWKSKEYAHKVLKNRRTNAGIKPNNKERILWNELSNNFILNVNAKYIIGNKIPDFIDFKNKKK